MGCGQSTNSILEPKGRKIIMMGAVGSGKTSVMYQVTKKMSVPAIPTVGHNAEFLSLGKDKYVLYDIGARNLDFGQIAHLLESAVALVFMIDAANPNSTILKESVDLFTQCVKHPHLQGLPIALCLNKQDLTNDIYIDEDVLARSFPLQLVPEHNYQIFKISYKTKLNIEAPFEWLAKQKLKVAPATKKQQQSNNKNNTKKNPPSSSYMVSQQQQVITDNPPNSNNIHDTQET